MLMSCEHRSCLTMINLCRIQMTRENGRHRVQRSYLKPVIENQIRLVAKWWNSKLCKRRMAVPKLKVSWTLRLSTTLSRRDSQFLAPGPQPSAARNWFRKQSWSMSQHSSRKKMKKSHHQRKRTLLASSPSLKSTSSAVANLNSKKTVDKRKY